MKAALFSVKALIFGGVLYSVSLVQSKENSHPPCVEDVLFVNKAGITFGVGSF